MSSLLFTLWFSLSLFVFISAETGKCGIVRKKDDRIVGGTSIQYYKYPWFAVLVKASNVKQLACGGSVISSRYVLSAAHCFKPYFRAAERGDMKLKDVYVIKLGVTNICVDSQPQAKIFKISEVHIHEKYYQNLLYYDIALLKLDSDASNYMPICLPYARYESNNRTGMMGTVVGLGKESTNAWRLPCLIKETNVELQSDVNCRNMLDRNHEDSTRSLNIICAGSLKGTVDTCQGDSGGPLHVTFEPEDLCVLFGITSFGFGCAKEYTYGVYTDVTHYLDWILENTKDYPPIQIDGNSRSNYHSTSSKQNTRARQRQRKPSRNILQDILNM